MGVINSPEIGNLGKVGFVSLLFIFLNIIMVGGVFAQGGLVAEYHFDGNASDSSGNGNDGTLMNGAGFDNGVSGQALSLDGVDDFVEVLSSESLKLDESVSISLWFKTDSTDAQSLVQKSTVHDINDNYWILINSGDYIYWDYGGVVDYSDTNSLMLNPSSWYHLAVSVTASGKGHIYLNGQEVSSYSHQLNAPGPLIIDDNPLLIGTDLNDNFFKGLIDEVQIYNKVLTPGEVLAEYEKHIIMSETGLVAEYHFEGYATDSSGNGNDGTLINGASFDTGINGLALNLDGIDDYVGVLSSESLKLNESVSISLWFKTDSTDAQSLVQKSEEHDVYDNYWILLNSGDYIYWDYGGVVDYSDTNSLMLNPSSWYHLAVLVTASGKGNIYLNGQEVPSYSHQISAPSPLFVDDNPLLIGTDLNNNFFKGLIDEVRIYNKVLTPEEVLAEYKRYMPPLHEVCGDGIDNDNDGLIDEDCQTYIEIDNVRISFENLISSGNTTINISLGNQGGGIPSGYKVKGTFFDITTTANYTGKVVVCVPYNETGQSESRIRLFHWDGKWKDITVSVDTLNNLVCGKTSSLSPFVALLDVDALGDPFTADEVPVLPIAGLFGLATILVGLAVFRMR